MYLMIAHVVVVDRRTLLIGTIWCQSSHRPTLNRTPPTT